MLTTVKPQTAVQNDAHVVLELAKAAIPTDSAVLELLQNLVTTLAEGQDAVLTGTGAELTPNQAAEMVGMSRPHLLSFMNSGALAFTYVGTHRRIKVADLIDFNERRQAARKVVAEARTNTTAAQARHIDEVAPISDEALAELDEL